MRREIEQVFFFLAGRRKFLKIASVDDHVAGRTCHYTLARTLERLAGGPGDIEQPLAWLCLNFLVECSVSLEKTHEGHASSFSCSTAARAIRWQASTSSCWVV